jgi:hypothetical protein
MYLLEIPEDEADYCSLDTVGRMFRVGRDVKMQIYLFLKSFGYYFTIANGEICDKDVNRSRKNDLCDIPLQHSKIADVVGEGLPVSC